MARGKQKYKDVVKSGGGGGFKGKNKNKTLKKKIKPRKTYSLFQNDNNKGSGSNKRKSNFHKNDDDFKRQKVEEEPEPEIESSSESEEEIEDHMKQLRNTFASSTEKKSLAIDSSEDSSEDEDEITVGTEEDENESIKEEEDENSNEDPDEKNEEEQDEKSENEENEEVEITVEAKEAENDEAVVDNADDPFVKHISYDLHENLLTSLQNIPPLTKTVTESWSTFGRLHVQIPEYVEVEEKKSSHTVNEDKKFAPAGSIPVKIDPKKANPSDLFIKPQIAKNLEKANSSVTNNQLFTPLQAELFSVINNYQDLYYPERTFGNAEEIRFVYSLHAVNHILKTRMKVVHHNARLTKKDDVPEEFRDQGLVRPKILIIVPFKDSAYKIIQMIIAILLTTNKGTVMNQKRFIEEYTGNEITMPKKNPKPEDYEMTFTGNTGDDFKIGMTVTKKSLKLYSDFYSSDIIVASPLGLRTIIGAEGEPERNYDFLASLELLIVDQTELFLMQNWDHLIHVFNHLHLQPKDSHGTDFSRVRTWSLNGWSKYYRQTLIFSSLVLPEINSIFNKKCTNYAGKVKISNVSDFGTISQVVVQLPHVFHKFEASSVQEAMETRFDFFTSKILAQQRDSLMKQTLIFVSSYFDYVRLRNYFKREEISFVQVCEYSKEGKIARARDMFYHGDAHFLLYTERHHFFNRIRIKGIRHIVFYQPPNFPLFYYEMCNLMQDANMNKKMGNISNMSVSVIYCKYDVQQLAAIVGTERAAKMLQSDRNVHMMMTGAD